MKFKLYKAEDDKGLLGESEEGSPKEAAIAIIQANVAVNNNAEISRSEIKVEPIDENSFRVTFREYECILRKS